MFSQATYTNQRDNNFFSQLDQLLKSESNQQARQMVKKKSGKSKQICQCLFDGCDKFFDSPYRLKKHLDPKFICEVCSKLFTYKCNWKKHMIVIHKAEMPGKRTQPKAKNNQKQTVPLRNQIQTQPNQSLQQSIFNKKSDNSHKKQGDRYLMQSMYRSDFGLDQPTQPVKQMSTTDSSQNSSLDLVVDNTSYTETAHTHQSHPRSFPNSVAFPSIQKQRIEREDQNTNTHQSQEQSNFRDQLNNLRLQYLKLQKADQKKKQSSIAYPRKHSRQALQMFFDVSIEYVVKMLAKPIY